MKRPKTSRGFTLPDDTFDVELKAQGKMRGILGDGLCYRMVVISRTSKQAKEFFKMFENNAQVTQSEETVKVAKTPKAPKEPKVTKLSQAIEVVKRTGKDDKPACLEAIVQALGVTKGNASIYYAKALAQLS